MAVQNAGQNDTIPQIKKRKQKEYDLQNKSSSLRL
jgi:hypothetical protein